MTDTNFGDPSKGVANRHAKPSNPEKVTGWKLMTPAQWDMFCYLRSNDSQSGAYYVRLIRQRV